MPANGCNGHGAPRATREVVRTYLPRAEQHRFSRIATLRSSSRGLLLAGEGAAVVRKSHRPGTQSHAKQQSCRSATRPSASHEPASARVIRENRRIAMLTSQPLTALLAHGAAFPKDNPARMWPSGAADTLADDERAAVWNLERRLLKAALLYADRAATFDNSPDWFTALMSDLGIQVRGHGGRPKQVRETVGPAADAARAYYRDLELAFDAGLVEGTGGFMPMEMLLGRQQDQLADPSNIPVLPSTLLGALEGFPDADMDVVLDIRERIAGSRTHFRAAMFKAAGELADGPEPELRAAVAEMRRLFVDPALLEIREQLDELGARRVLLRAASDRTAVAAAAAIVVTVAAATGIGAPLAAAVAPFVATAANEAERRAKQMGELRRRPYWLLHETGELLREVGSSRG